MNPQEPFAGAEPRERYDNIAGAPGYPDTPADDAPGADDAQLADHPDASGEAADTGPTTAYGSPDDAAVDQAAADQVAGDEVAAEAAPGAAATAQDRGVASADEPAGADIDLRDPTELPPLRAALEAVLLVVDEPVAEVTLAQVVERPTEEVHATLQALAEEYTAQGRGFDLRNVSGGWRLYTRPDCAPYVERFVLDGQQARLTQAALETLAVVAYRQPVTRGRVSAIRGVNVDGVMRTLLTRGLVEESGADADSGATLYRTTSYFLERLGLTSLDDLPALAPHLPDAETLEADVDAAST